MLSTCSEQMTLRHSISGGMLIDVYKNNGNKRLTKATSLVSPRFFWAESFLVGIVVLFVYFGTEESTFPHI